MQAGAAIAVAVAYTTGTAAEQLQLPDSACRQYSQLLRQLSLHSVQVVCRHSTGFVCSGSSWPWYPATEHVSGAPCSGFGLQQLGGVQPVWLIAAVICGASC
jgi:uncharacterized protein (DUF779 family)